MVVKLHCWFIVIAVFLSISVECSPPAEVCDDGVTCIRKDLFCDGILDCPDGSDELEKRCGKNVNLFKVVFLSILKLVSIFKYLISISCTIKSKLTLLKITTISKGYNIYLVNANNFI